MGNRKQRSRWRYLNLAKGLFCFFFSSFYCSAPIHSKDNKDQHCLMPHIGARIDAHWKEISQKKKRANRYATDKFKLSITILDRFFFSLHSFFWFQLDFILKGKRINSLCNYWMKIVLFPSRSLCVCVYRFALLSSITWHTSFWSKLNDSDYTNWISHDFR